ncbi:MAG: zinc-binding alcohol dehydrogenase [Chloroflexi bacterium]|nr:zinc-binding alcohol dehydrogenase [Chloroflexota bacterium]
MKAYTLFFTASRQVEIRESDLPALQDDEVLVETRCSAISAGTERLVYRGEFPHLADAHDTLSSELRFPLAYGYACVGQVKAIGKLVSGTWKDRLVFSFQPHTSHFIAKPESLITIPPLLSPETACFLPNMETAVNLVQDGAPILGERVLVLGQGVIGLLVASLLREFPLEKLVTSDCYALRRKASLEIGVNDSFDPGLLEGNSNTRDNIFDIAYTQNFDLTFELSGSPSALNDAIALTAFSGRILIGSWYGKKKAPIDLGGAFHRSRIRLISSQVSTIAPALSGRWDKARRFEVAWAALKRIQPQKWITHRFPIEEAEKAYRLLDENPQETIQVVFEYEM